MARTKEEERWLKAGSQRHKTNVNTAKTSAKSGSSGLSKKTNAALPKIKASASKGGKASTDATNGFYTPKEDAKQPQKIENPLETVKQARKARDAEEAKRDEKKAAEAKEKLSKTTDRRARAAYRQEYMDAAYPLSRYDKKLPTTSQQKIQEAKRLWEASKEFDAQGRPDVGAVYRDNAHFLAESTREDYGYRGGSSGTEHILPELSGRDLLLNEESRNNIRRYKLGYEYGEKTGNKSIMDAASEVADLTRLDAKNYERRPTAVDAHGRTRELPVGREVEAQKSFLPAIGFGIIGGLDQIRKTAPIATRQAIDNSRDPELQSQRQNYRTFKELAAQAKTKEEREAYLASAEEARAAAENAGDKTVAETSKWLEKSQEHTANVLNASDNPLLKMLGQTAIGIGQMVPALASAAIPVVGPALSLGSMAAVAAGSKMGELSQEGKPASEAFGRGVVSGAIEAATGKVPLGKLSKIIKGETGKSLLRNTLEQTGITVSEESISYVANFIADKAAQDPHAKFSLSELANSAFVGGLSGGVMGGGASLLSGNAGRLVAKQEQAGEAEAARGTELPIREDVPVTEAPARPESTKIESQNPLIRAAENARVDRDVVVAPTKDEPIQDYGKMTKKQREAFRANNDPAPTMQEYTTEKYEEAPDEYQDYDGYSIDDDVPPDDYLPEGMGAMSSGGAGDFASWQANTPGDQFHPINTAAAERTAEVRGRAETEVPLRDPDGNLTSKALSTLLNASITPNEVNEILSERAALGAFSYNQGSLQRWHGEARRRVDENYAGALSAWEISVRNGEASPEITALGVELMRRAAESGDTATAIRVATDSISNAHTSASALAARRLISMATPEGQLYSLVRTSRRLQENANRTRENDGEAPGQRQREDFANEIRRIADEETSRLRQQIEDYSDIIDTMHQSFEDEYGAEDGGPADWVRALGEELARNAASRASNGKTRARTIYQTVESDLQAFMRNYVDNRRQQTPRRTADDYIRNDVGTAMREIGIKVSEIMREPNQTKEQAAHRIADRVLMEYDVSTEGATAIAEAVTNQFFDRVNAAARKHLDAMFQPRSQRARKTLNERFDEMANMGAFANPEFNERATAKLFDVAHIEVNEDLARDYLNARTDEERESVRIEILRDLAQQVPPTWHDKFNAWRDLAMLCNLRTHVRNISGTAAFAPVRAAKSATAAVIESAVDPKVRTKAVLNHFGKEDRARINVGYADYSNVKDIVLGGGKYNDNWNKIDEYRTIFRFKPLEKLRAANSNALEIEDMWFSKPAYAGALAQYLKANGITANEYMSENFSPEKRTKAQEYAIKEARKATFRDVNQFSELVSRLGKFHREDANTAEKVAGYLIEGQIPFKATPANVLVRAVEYSPIGILNGLKQMAVDVRNPNSEITAAEAIDNFSAGLTGTGLMLLGGFLAKLGIVVGGGSGDDKQDDFNELQGHQNYALEIGDTSITLDWMAPAALPFFVGVEFFNNLIDRDDGEFQVGNMLESIANLAEPILEMSMLSGLNDAIDSFFTEDNKIFGVAGNILFNYLGQFIPTAFGQLERAMEDKRYITYIDRESRLPPKVQRFLANQANKIPGWEYNQIPYVDAWGREESTGESPLTRALNNFLNPAYISKINTTDADKELQRLYDAGFEDVFPSRAETSTKINDKYLTGDQYLALQTERGRFAHSAVSDAIATESYKALTDAEKAKVIEKIYDLSRDKSKLTLGQENEELAKWMQAAVDAKDKVGLSAGEVVTAYGFRSQAKRLG